MDNPLKLDRAGFRQWLSDNHDTAKSCEILVRRGMNRPDLLPYLDAVEEALCFGWIDSTQKSDGHGGSIQRFSPRRPNSSFTRLNLARCERLEQLGLMTDSGREAMPSKPYRNDRYVLDRISKDPQVMENIVTFPRLYVEIRLDNIVSCRRQAPKLYRKRMERFLEATRDGKMYGDWDDDGRLPHEPLFTLDGRR